MQKTRKHGVHRDKNGRDFFFFLKKRIKFAERKWHWKMYSPSGSKRFQLKRNRAYGGGGGLLLVCRRVCTAALRPSLRSVTPPVSESRDSDWSFLNRSEIFFIYLFSRLFPRQRHIGASVAGIELGWSCLPVPRLTEQRPVTSVRAAGTTTGTSTNQPFWSSYYIGTNVHCR